MTPHEDGEGSKAEDGTAGDGGERDEIALDDEDLRISRALLLGASEEEL